MFCTAPLMLQVGSRNSWINKKQLLKQADWKRRTVIRRTLRREDRRILKIQRLQLPSCFLCDPQIFLIFRPPFAGVHPLSDLSAWLPLVLYPSPLGWSLPFMIPREDGFKIFIYYANIVLFDPMPFYFYLLICLFPLFHFALQHLVLFNSALKLYFVVILWHWLPEFLYLF